MRKSEKRQRGTVEGKQFELIFERICRLRGFLPRKLPLSARWIGPGKLLPVKSELDYQLIHPEFGLAFIDTKTIAGAKFSFSHFDNAQLSLSALLNEWGQRSGFVVWFRDPNLVIYFPIKTVIACGSGKSLTPEDGIALGTVPNFYPAKIFA